MAAAYPVVALVGSRITSAPVWGAAALAAAICWFAAALALVLFHLFQRAGNPLSGALVGMLVRFGIPLGAGLVATVAGGPLREGGFIEFILVFYFVGLATETVLSLAMSRLKTRPGRPARRDRAMADSMLHIKDSYFFEVPKFMWHHHWTSLDQVPHYLTAARPGVTNVEKWNEAMAGKILIPQPFGTLKNLTDERGCGFCISKFMILELVAAIVLVAVFVRLGAARFAWERAPRGGLWNMARGVLGYLRDDVARPAIGKP